MQSQLQSLEELEALTIEQLWLQGELEFLLWEQQIPIWRALNSIPEHVTEFVNLLARQFGKSVIGCAWALSQAIKHRDKAILIMGPDIKQTRAIVEPRMRMLLKTAPPGLVKYVPSEDKWLIYQDLDQTSDSFSEVMIGGFKEGASSERGKTLQHVLVEEVVDVHEDRYLYQIRSVLGPALTHSNAGKIVFNTTLPKYAHHPFITETIPEAKLNDAFMCFTIDDNTALSPEQKAATIKRSGGWESDDTKRELRCIVITDKSLACVPNFVPSRDVGEFDLPMFWYPQVVIDWGGVRDKTCALLYTYDYMLNLILWIDERVFEPNTATAHIMPEVYAMERQWAPLGVDGKVRSRWVDAPPNFVENDLWNDYKYRAKMPFKQDWEACLNGFNNRFHRNQARIHPRCKFFAISCESGVLNKNRTDFERTKALGHMDGVAAGMYGDRMVDKSNPWPAHVIMPGQPVQQILQPSQHSAIITSTTQDTQAKPRIPLSHIAQPYREPRGFGKHRR